MHPMKYICSTIFVLSAMLTFAQAKINQVDGAGKKHGVWEKNYENGKLRYRGTFDHGVEVGTFKFYFESGDLRAINKFRGKTGVCYSYQFGGDSIVAAEGKYIKSKRDSIWTFYDIDGNVVSREGYKNDKKNGLSETYYDNKKVAESFVYVNDKKVGPWLQFYDTGKPRTKGTYVEGSLQGEIIYYFPSGKPEIKGNYARGIMHGNWYFFDENMKVVKKQVWKFGTLVSQDPEEKKDESLKELDGKLPGEGEN